MKQKITEWSLYLLLIGMIGGQLFLIYDGNVLLLLCAFLSFLLSLILIPALHETGHFVFGKKAGFSLVLLSVAGFAVRMEQGKKIFSFTPTGDAGECRMFSPDVQDMKKRLWYMTLGGTVFNGVYVLIVSAILIFFHSRWVLASIGMTLPYAVYLLIVNLLPFENYDGYLIFGLWRKDPSAETLANIFAFQCRLFYGDTPAQVGKELLFSLPQLPEDDPVFALLYYLRYLCFLDMGATDEAVKAICRLEEEGVYLPRSIERAVYLELVYVYSVLREDRGKAENYWVNAVGFNNYLSEEMSVSAACKRASLAYAVTSRNEPIYLAWRDRTTEKEELAGLQILEERLLKELLKDIDSFDGK